MYRNGLADIFNSDLAEKAANTGLWYDRYADIWSGSGGNWKPDTPPTGPSARQLFLGDICAHAQNSAVHVAPLLAALQRRRLALWRACRAQIVLLELDTPLNSGFGMTHALESGMVWDRNLGLPFLPGATLKGVARAWAKEWTARDVRDIGRIFGDVENDGVGSVIFHSLYPTSVPELRVDLLDPHVKPGRQEAPGDWLSPQPLFFLTVARRTKWITAVQPRSGTPDGDVEMAVNWLRTSLTTLGAGAKTATGYGLFVPLPDEQLAEIEAVWGASATLPRQAPARTGRRPRQQGEQPSLPPPGRPSLPGRQSRGGPPNQPRSAAVPSSSPDAPPDPAHAPTIDDLQKRYAAEPHGVPQPPQKRTRADKAREEQRRLMERLRATKPEVDDEQSG